MFKTYSEYKQSLSRFGGNVPGHWVERRLANVCSMKVVQNNSGEDLLSVFLNRGVVRYSDTSQRQVHKPSEDMSKYQLVEPGDLVLNNQQAWRGSVGVSKYRGIISPAYYVFWTISDINPSFMNYMVRDKGVVDQFVLSSKGVGSIQRTLYDPYLKNVIFALPPRTEQDQIVRFLDSKLSKIAKLINAKKKQIALLKEQKQAIINKAVTKGLDPNAKMKPSGVEWLGEIPAGWEIVKLREILSPVSIKNRPELPLLSVVREEGIILRDKEDKESNHNFIPDDLSGYKVVQRGQFVINKMKSWQGSYGISPFQGIVSPAYFVFDVNFDNLDYFHHAIRSKIYVSVFAQSSDGIRTDQWDLSMQKMKEILFFVPSKEEQKQIISYIEQKSVGIDKAISTTEREIALIGEYKTRLISDAVTGKIDVRNIDVADVEVEQEIEIDETEENGDEDEKFICEEEASNQC